MLKAARLVALLTLAAAPALSMADSNLKLSGIFSDHMVLQRNVPLKIWGIATPEQSVKVEFNGTNAQAKADAAGKWLAKLPEQKAGGPYELTVSADDETTTIKDVLVGEVWVASGQSNMDFDLKNAKNAEQAIASSSNNNIRLFVVPRNKAVKPLQEFDPGSAWQVASPESSPNFSAVAYFFGRELHKDLNVPIGLIESAWGGTAAEWWMPFKALEKIPSLVSQAKAMETAEPESILETNYKNAVQQWRENAKAKDPGIDNGNWASANFDDSSWKKTTIADNTNQAGLKKFDGSAWFRRNIELTSDQAEAIASLAFQADDDDVAYVNGVKVGSWASAGGQRDYKIPANLLKPGNNSITIQVWDWAKEGGIWGDADNFALRFSDSNNTTSLSLAGDWKTTHGVSLTDLPPQPTPPGIRPTVLYNAMIAPLKNLAIKGVIWYQGENNAGDPTRAINYDEVMAALISEWRNQWGLGDFPFFQVELASFTKIQPEPGESNWAVLRESQMNVMNLIPKTAVASAVDVGDESDIHPTDKETVGKRLALNALAIGYGKEIEFIGPIFKQHTIDGNKVHITFDHAKKLQSKGGEKLKGFAIAGADKKFVWADATIDGDKVTVSSDTVDNPLYVRYGWANYSEGNLYNEAGLPANPFRTDSPKAKTQDVVR